MTELSDEERLAAVQDFFRTEMIPTMKKVMWSCAAVGALAALGFNLLLLSIVVAAR